jgi:hypothetical protein
MGLPSTFLVLLLITPLMGWYSDKMPRISYRLLGSVALGSAALTVFCAKEFVHTPPKEIPPLAWTFALSGLATVSAVSVFLGVVQMGLAHFRRHVGGGRIWINYLATAMLTVTTGATYLVISRFSPAGGPTAVVWLLLTKFTDGLAAANAVVTAPLFYDFVPRDKLGTVSSGFGFVGGILSAGLACTGGLWIHRFSAAAPAGTVDYASSYAYQFGVGLLSFGVLTGFLAALRRGRVIEYGRLGLLSQGGTVHHTARIPSALYG